MRCFLLIFSFSYTFACFGQRPAFASKDQHVDNCPEQENEISFFCVLEIDAEIDLKKWITYLTQNLELDSLATDTIPSGVYKVITQFIIDTTGRMHSVKILKDPGFGLGTKVSQVLSANKILWTPATRNGRRIKSYKKQVIEFKIEKEKCESELPTGLML